VGSRGLLGGGWEGWEGLLDNLVVRDLGWGKEGESGIQERCLV
jgi:hypothetical protein